MKMAIAMILVLGGLVLLARFTPAQTPGSTAPKSENNVAKPKNNALLLEKKVLSLAAAHKMAAAAIDEAEKNHWRGVIAVVDDGGWLILLERMDNAAMTASVELAAEKARSAALFKKPSQQLEEAINHGRYAAITARGFVEMQGALPVVVDGQVVGAIGASFATPEQDVKVAQAGLDALTQ
jgi:glc operon protein GlcG